MPSISTSIGRAAGVSRARRPFSPAGCLAIRTHFDACNGRDRREAPIVELLAAGSRWLPTDRFSGGSLLACTYGSPAALGTTGAKSRTRDSGTRCSIYTGYGNKVKVGRYQSSRMPFVFVFLIWPLSIQPACLGAKFAPDTILDGVWRCWGVDWTLLRYSSDKVMC